MPQIPDFTALGNSVPTPAYRRPFMDESGVEIADALTGAGKALYQRQQAEQQANATTLASNQLTNLRVQATQQFLDAKGKAAPDAANFTPTVLDQFDQAASNVTDGLKGNTLASGLVGKALPQLRAQVQEQAMQWEAGQRTAFRSQSVLDNANKLSIVAEADPTQQIELGKQLVTQVNSLGLDPTERLRLAHAGLSQLEEATGRGLAKQDPLGTINRLGDPNDASFPNLTPPQRDGLVQYARGQLVSGQATALAQVYAQNGPDAGAKAMAALDSNAAVPADLRDEVRKQVNGQVAQLRDDRRNLYAQSISQLEQNIQSGQVGPADRATAEMLWNKNALDPSQLAATFTAINNAEIKQAHDQAAQAAITDAYVNHTPLDPEDPTAKKGVSALFLGLARGAQPGDPAYVGRALDIASRTGVVPAPAISWARANLSAGEPVAAVQSADLVARLEEQNPRAVGFDIDERTKAMADTISGAVRAGTPAPIAVQMARTNASLPPAQLEDLKQRWQASKPETSQPGALQDLLKGNDSFKGGWFSGGVPTVPTAMQGDFDQSTRRYFDLTGGNLTQARELAARDVARVYGVSQVNGQRQIMLYAPEAMFPGLSADVVHQDIAATVEANPQAFQHLDPATGKLVPVQTSAQDVRLIPTDRTARTNGLEWNLGAPDQFGAMDVLRGPDGNPLTYRLPVNTTDLNAVRNRMDQAGIAKARQLQADQAAAEQLHDAERQAGFADDEGMR